MFISGYVWAHKLTGVVANLNACVLAPHSVGTESRHNALAKGIMRLCSALPNVAFVLLNFRAAVPVITCVPRHVKTSNSNSIARAPDCLPN